MKKKLILLTLIISVCALFLGGCQLGYTLDDIKGEYTYAEMVYFANGGGFNDSDLKETGNIYYKENAYPYEIRTKDTSADGEKQILYVYRYNHIFDGWYEVDCNADGSPIYVDADGNVVDVDEKGKPIYADSKSKTYVKLTDNKVDFTQKVSAGIKYVGARWASQTQVIFKVVSDKAVTTSKTDAEGNAIVYNNGDVIKTAYFGSNDKYAVQSSDPLFSSGDDASSYLADMQYVEIYADEACTVPVGNTTLTKGDSDTTIYVKYVDKSYKLVKNADDVKNMFKAIGLGLAKNVYFVVNDVDCSTVSISSLTSFKGKIMGNGKTISNVTVSFNGLKGDAKASPFGKLEATASIENLTLSNVVIKYGIAAGNPNTYGLFRDVVTTATVKNFTVDGIKMQISGAQENKPANMQYGEYDATVHNWLFGGFSPDSSVAFGGESASCEVEDNVVLFGSYVDGTKTDFNGIKVIGLTAVNE